MTQEGRVEDFWSARRRNQASEDNVRPLLKALAAARRSLEEEHYAGSDVGDSDAIVVDIRPQRIVPADIAPRRTAGRLEHPATQAFPEPEPDPVAPFAPAAPPRTIKPDWIMVDVPPRTEPTVVEPAEPAPEWGELWRESVQGWVRDKTGTKIWRPIVTTTTSVPNWEIDTNLGMVTGESACALDEERLGILLQSASGAAALRRELAEDRRTAETSMVGDAVARGAHAVIGVKLDYTPVGDCLIVTATGTAVTLRTPR